MLIDTNIVVDVLTHMDIFYITAKLLGSKEHAKNLLKKLIGMKNIFRTLRLIEYINRRLKLYFCEFNLSVNIQLVVNYFLCRFYGVLADKKFRGYLLRGQPFARQQRYFALPVRQRG